LATYLHTQLTDTATPPAAVITEIEKLEKVIDDKTISRGSYVEIRTRLQGILNKLSADWPLNASEMILSASAEELLNLIDKRSTNNIKHSTKSRLRHDQ
jgi:hypothetical protein